MTGSFEADLVILVISGLFVILAVVGIIEQIKRHRRVNGDDYAIAEGEFVDIKTEMPNNERTVQYQSIYEFTAYDGKKYRHVTHDVGQVVRPQIGFTRKIAYKKSDPTQSEFYANYRGIVIAVLCLVCAGLVILLGIRGSAALLGS